MARTRSRKPNRQQNCTPPRDLQHRRCSLHSVFTIECVLCNRQQNCTLPRDLQHRMCSLQNVFTIECVLCNRQQDCTPCRRSALIKEETQRRKKKKKAGLVKPDGRQHVEHLHEHRSEGQNSGAHARQFSLVQFSLVQFRCGNSGVHVRQFS